MNIASSFSSGSSLIKLGVTATHAGANVYKSVTQYNTVNGQLSISLTKGVGSNPTSAKNSNPNQEEPKKKNEVTKKGLDLSGLKSAMAISVTFAADDVTGVGVIDDVLIPFVVIGGAVYTVYNNKELIAKYIQETERIFQRALGPNGFQYSLRATVDGYYPNVRGGKVFLKAGEVWKFGETTSTDRYSPRELKSIGPGVLMLPEVFGNQVEIKVAEKIKIYSYVIQNGNSPPGNTIFR